MDIYAKNILQIMDYAAPYKGNFILSIERLEKSINEKGNSLVYLFPDKAQYTDWASSFINSGKSVYFVENSFFSKKVRWNNIRKIIRIVQEEKIDIIHTHFVFYNYALLLLKMIFLRKVITIGHFHNHFHPPANKFRRFKIWITSKTYDQIIGVSISVAESVILSGISKKKVCYITNAIDFKRLDHFKKISLKNENPGRKVILIFGWPFYRKGVDLAIDAVKQVREAGHDAILVISLPGGKEQIRQDIVNYCGSVLDWINIIDARNDVSTYYNASDIFLSAGREEGLNYSVVEAAYAEPHVIISNIPGNPQDIPGLFKFELGNVSQLYQTIVGALSTNEDEKKRIKNIQRDYVQKSYNLDDWCNAVLEHYK